MINCFTISINVMSRVLCDLWLILYQRTMKSMPRKGGHTKHMEHMGCHYCRKCHFNLQYELWLELPGVKYRNQTISIRFVTIIYIFLNKLKWCSSRMNTIKIIDYDLSDTPCILEVTIFGDLSYFCQILKSIRSFHACQDTQFSFNKRSKLQNRQK